MHLFLAFQEVEGIVFCGHGSPCIDGKQQVPAGARAAIGQSPVTENIFYALLAVGNNGAWRRRDKITARGIKA